MNTNVDLTTLLLGAFPASQAGKISDVYYTVTTMDDTGAPGTHIAKTQNNIIAADNGAYGVNLIFAAEGTYNIFWEIDGTPYKANEEINVFANIYDHIDSAIIGSSTNYSGYGTGNDRYDADINTAITLEFNFTKNNVLFEPLTWTKVEIYDSYADAVNDTNIVETITTFTNVSTGKVSYSPSNKSIADTYFDKIYIVPEAAVATQTFISPFYVKNTASGTPTPSTHEKARIYLNIFDIIDVPQKNDWVKVRMNVKSAWYGNDIIKQEEEIFKADENGLVTMDLIETGTMTADTFADTGDDSEVYYKFNIAGKKILQKVIPKGTTSANLIDLSEPTTP